VMWLEKNALILCFAYLLPSFSLRKVILFYKISISVLRRTSRAKDTRAAALLLPGHSPRMNLG